MKFFGVLAAAVVGLSALTAQAAPVNLQLSVVQSGAGTWDAFATITGDTARTLGLGGVEFTVAGTGGIAITGSTIRLPQGAPLDGNGDPFSTGFTQFRTSGSLGAGMRGAQSTPSYTISDNGISNILTGVGLTAGTQSGATWAFPVRIGSGTFSGTVGALTIVGNPANTTFLPATLPANAPGGTVGIQTFSPDAVLPGTTPIGVPEPASLGVLALGGAALLTRRRKA